MSDIIYEYLKENTPENIELRKKLLDFTSKYSVHSFNVLKDFYENGRLGDGTFIGGTVGSGQSGEVIGKDIYFPNDIALDRRTLQYGFLFTELYDPYIKRAATGAFLEIESFYNNILSSDYPSLFVYTQRCNIYLANLFPNGGEEVVLPSEAEGVVEKVAEEETEVGSSLSTIGLDTELGQIIYKVYGPYYQSFSYDSGTVDQFSAEEYTSIEDRFFKSIVNGSRIFSLKEKNNINAIFAGSDLTRMNDVSSNTAKFLAEALESTGLLRILAYTNEVAEFAKARLKNVGAVRASIADYEDLLSVPLLQQFSIALNNVKQNPIAFSVIQWYFPSLVNYFVSVVSLLSDFSADGIGGAESDPVNDERRQREVLIRAFGIDRQTGEQNFDWATENTAKRIKDVVEGSNYFRKNVAPESPDIFHLRIGVANFYVPPVSIDVNTIFKTGSLTGGAIRQSSSPKFNSGYKETTVRMRLFFPNYQEIWGVDINPNSTIGINENIEIDFKSELPEEDRKIDKFLSSLRGLVAAFKCSPILPIKNHYLNVVHGITGVALSGMTVSTVPGFPFSLVVDLELLNFNHTPFYPMLKDFNQSINWGKYRTYMGNAAGKLASYVDADFLIKTSDKKAEDQPNNIGNQEPAPIDYAITGNDPVYEDGVLKINPIREWEDGKGLTLYAPAETQTKIFLPDTSSFRSDQERLITDFGTAFWEGLMSRFGIDINAQNSYGKSLSETINLSRSTSFNRSIRNVMRDIIPIMTSGVNSSDFSETIYNYLVNIFISENSSLTADQKSWLRDRSDAAEPTQYPQEFSYKIYGRFEETSLNRIKRTFYENANSNVESFLGSLIERYGEDKEQEIINSFNVLMYESIFETGLLKDMMEASRARNSFYQFREWEVPMLRVDLDPDYVTINGVSVSLGNNFAKLQVQMMDEPTYQHIGGRDTYIDISMTVRGEKELFKIKKLFDHVSNLARLEHATGVIGFLGIKNVITALVGVKYALPLNYSVNTIPNYPHFYSVQLSLADFDIFQQKREELSSAQQRELVEEFGTKKNPFFRIKQLWGKTNTYPDFPLAVRNSEGEVVGHLDPDFYFRSFEMFDRDIVHNIEDQTEKIENYDLLSQDKRRLVQIAINDFLVNYYITIPEQDLDPRTKGYRQQQLIRDLASNVLGLNISFELFKELFNKYVQEFFERNKDIVIGPNRQVQVQRVEQKLLLDYTNLDSADNQDASAENTIPYSENDYTGSASIGIISPNSEVSLDDIRRAFSESAAGDGENKEDIVSLDLDEVTFAYNLFTIPVASDDPSETYAVMNTAIGHYVGSLKEVDGKVRFYPTIGGQFIEVKDDAAIGIKLKELFDGQSPDVGTTNALTGVPHATPLSEYQKPYEKGVRKHWESMFIDTSYRDISGRMLRAFPTYMLWLIDEGGYFAGVKMFDNFYGLQSIIDFSVFSSEDVMGDTLVFRVSNLYSKLSTPDSRTILNPNVDNFVEPRELTLTEGIQGIVDSTLNRARNILSGLNNSYIVDINNIRLKPGVRVHLRMGYGSNPNSLQTVFNGTITQVEVGEIVTVTAQSDAIEFGAIVNTTNKKGDSGKIDGGVDTGMWLSEPRDLMVRLLSMGASTAKEAISWANRGVVFSENKFGIRHFGTMLYEPLTDSEAERVNILRSNIVGAFNAVGGNDAATTKAGSLWRAGSGGQTFTNLEGFRAVGNLMGNFAAKRDLEIFKRNIYPGNGTGLAQFLGGDLDDGWSSISSYVPEERYSDRVEGYLGRTTDYMWNRLLEQYQNPSNVTANETLDSLVEDKALNESKKGAVASAVMLGGLAAGAALFGGPIIATAGVATGLLGILSGRGGQNIFRTLGVISTNPDDDLSGFDEVSFRAQTYMRTVWDLFQVCARLLPNYIVAVRPFEDRSTVFYGKPHWLYTSGVVPVTTGYRGDRDIKVSDPDEELVNLLEAINASSNQLADLDALGGANEVTSLFSASAGPQINSTGEYAPTSSMVNRIVAFNSEPARNYKGCKIPVNSGLVDIGFHLPISTQGSTVPGQGTQKQTEALISTQSSHLQINNLPPRYRFPFFADVIEDENETIYSSNFFQQQAYDVTERRRIFRTDSSYYVDLLRSDALFNLEVDFYSSENITQLQPNADGPIEFDTILPVQILNERAEQLPIYSTRLYQTIRMPLPEGSEYLEEIGSVSPYSDFGMPQTPQDEQFYIAMRWPYIPDSVDQEKFKNKYFPQGITLSGSAKDYKDRKVLVYNPLVKRAVVCKPAYFLWDSIEGQSKPDAIVSPDAAYHLGLLTDLRFYASGDLESDIDDILYLPAAVSGNPNANRGFSSLPSIAECYFAFVPDEVPLGVISPNVAPAEEFGSEVEGEFIVGFGSFPENSLLVRQETVAQDARPTAFINYSGEASTGFNESRPTAFINYSGEAFIGSSFDVDSYVDSTTIYRVESFGQADTLSQIRAYGGNPLSIYEAQDGSRGNYFSAILNEQYEALESSTLKGYLEQDVERDKNIEQRSYFAPVYNAVDEASVLARSYYDENYSSAVSVIAGNGRTLSQATEIWDQFRQGYHTYESVKDIFRRTFYLDPDSTDELPEIFSQIFTDNESVVSIDKFSSTNGNAQDEFSLLFGADWNSNTSNSVSLTDDNRAAIEFIRSNLIDEVNIEDEQSLIDFFNNIILRTMRSLRQNLLENNDILNTLGFSISNESASENGQQNGIAERIRTPKQIFLLLVGIFRQRMWSTPYARAWLVLRPDRKRFAAGNNIDDRWSFRPVDKVFQAFIDPYSTYGKDNSKFLKLLASLAKEGSSASNIFGGIAEDVSDFVSRNIAPIMSGVANALFSLMSIFKLNLLMTGYALNEAGKFGAQANILNKALNDSIYYSLGRPGELLRAVDNPFTREYGEPVLEIREPFQRMHYLSSYSHILANRIQENINGVATTVTAYSDGKYPVTVAMDKSVPAERQVEKTAETGIYYDNPIGSGITGILHPLMHPFETARGVIKNATGVPDELMAKRVALAHLKESLKDMYGGELIIIGNADIRPHDLVYIADVYERMYGIFEVEQVIHHFTTDLGFITSIVPNALVTVNDPARWFMSSWVHSWFSRQNMRNSVRKFLDSAISNNTTIGSGGVVDVEAIYDSLEPEMVGSVMYTNGHSALLKDIVALDASVQLPAKADAYLSSLSSSRSGAAGNAAAVANGTGAVAGGIGMISALAAGTGGAATIGIGALAFAPVASLVWNGWKWIRDNVLDQHGCYVQYLTKNGQAMDAGLSYNQGMVVGSFHTKALLPGILGVRSEVKTPEGYTYIRTDDLLKNLGWRETEIKELVRHVSYESSLVHARVLGQSGLAPDRLDMEPYFKVLAKLDRIIDGDTVDVADIITNQVFRIRFSGIDTGEINTITQEVDQDLKVEYLYLSTPGGRAKIFTDQALNGNPFVLKIYPKRNTYVESSRTEDFEAGTSINKVENYVKDQTQSERTIATVFYKVPVSILSSNIEYVENVFRKVITDSGLDLGNNITEFRITTEFKKNLSVESVFYSRFSKILNETKQTLKIKDFIDYIPNFNIIGDLDNDPFYELLLQGTTGTDIEDFDSEYARLFIALVKFKNLEYIYGRISEWPMILWDEYYEDGSPVSLNWELVVNNLARVYVKDLQTMSQSADLR